MLKKNKRQAMQVYLRINTLILPSKQEEKLARLQADL